MKNKNVIYLGIVGVQVLLNLDQERGVIQFDVTVRNALTLFVVMSCTGIIYLIIIVAFVFFVILRSLHLFVLTFICHLFAPFWSRGMSCCCEYESAKVSIFRYNTLSSANSLILDVRLFSMSLMYRRNRSGPSTVPWGTPDVTIMCF